MQRGARPSTICHHVRFLRADRLLQAARRRGSPGMHRAANLGHRLQRPPSAGALRSRALPHEPHANGGLHAEDTLAQQLSIDQKPGGVGPVDQPSLSTKVGSEMFLGGAGAAPVPPAARTAMSFESCRSRSVWKLIALRRSTTLLFGSEARDAYAKSTRALLVAIWTPPGRSRAAPCSGDTPRAVARRGFRIS